MIITKQLVKIFNGSRKKRTTHTDPATVQRTFEMPLLSKSLYLISCLQLLHSGFSSYEFNQVTKNIIFENDDNAFPTLPNDIKLEVVSGLVLFFLATILSYSQLQYLTVRGPAKIISTGEYLQPINLHEASNIDLLTGSDPFGEINYHPSFVDIREKRSKMKEYLSKKQ